jgi:hypothetical protein
MECDQEEGLREKDASAVWAVQLKLAECRERVLEHQKNYMLGVMHMPS